MGILSVVIVAITPLLWVVFLLICLLFWTYRKFVDIRLRLKLGPKYGGLLNYSDGFAFCGADQNLHICCISIHNSETKMNMLEFFKERLNEEVLSNPDLHPKLTGTLHTSMGYCYWLKNSIDIDKCLKFMPAPENVKLSEELVKTMTSNLLSSPLPQNNSAPFDMHFVDRPIIVKDGTSVRYRYFTIIRMHHVVGDGTAITAFFMKLFGKAVKRNYIEEIFEQKSPDRNRPVESMSRRQYLIKKLKELLSALHITFSLIFLIFQKRLEMIDLRKKDVNALHGPNVSGQKITVWQWEESEKCVPLVKKIKNRFSDVSFSNVCITALAGGLGSYFKKNNLEMPDHISTFLTLVLNLPKVDLSKPLPLVNRSTAVLLEIPLKGFENHRETIQKVKQNIKNISYFEALTNSMFLKYIFTLFPMPIRANMLDSETYTAVLSVVPGVDRVETIDGCYCENIIGCPPNVNNIGVSICIMTYDNRLTIALLADKALLSSQKKAQEIVDDFFKNLETLDVETSI